MFIAHLPAGYLLACGLTRKIPHQQKLQKNLMFFCLIGSIFPDIDLLYFYFVDGGQTHHHKFFTHWPIVWLPLLLVFGLRFLFLRKKFDLLCAGFFFAGFIHLILDTFVGDIWWLAPFIDQPFAFFTVPAITKPWWLNFVIHWSFAVEVFICFWAGFLFFYKKRS